MNNTAEITNDGVCVYFNSKVKISKLAKVILVLLNILALSLYVLILSSVMDDDPMTKGTIISCFLVLPSVYIFSIGLITLWNLFGEENIIINAKSISNRKYFGFFTTQWKVRQFRNLYYEIEIKKEELKLGTITFIDHNQLDLPVPIFSSSVYVSEADLKELVNQLQVVFTIEHLTKDGNNYIHLN